MVVHGLSLTNNRASAPQVDAVLLTRITCTVSSALSLLPDKVMVAVQTISGNLASYSHSCCSAEVEGRYLAEVAAWRFPILVVIFGFDHFLWCAPLLAPFAVHQNAPCCACAPTAVLTVPEHPARKHRAAHRSEHCDVPLPHKGACVAHTFVRCARRVVAGALKLSPTQGTVRQRSWGRGPARAHPAIGMHACQTARTTT
jgi:hypothetical protein